ncbi:MAG: patatin-like phospholipase family protein [Hyphomonadaceae bacterium]
MDDAGARPITPEPPQPDSAVARRLAARGAKRVLAIDGGGVRGIVATGLLAAVEQRLRRRTGRPNARLCDYFDLIGGVSTGAVIAAALAMGRSAAEIADFFRALARDAPAGQSRRGRFDAQRMDALLAQGFGDTALGGDGLRTGLAIGAKRTDVGGVWWVANNPRAPLWAARRNGPGDRDLLVRQLLQASLGAAVIHEERVVQFTGPAGETGVGAAFVDAALAGANNPSLHLLHLATLPGHGLEWLSGHDQLLMVSVGAGDWRGGRAAGDPTAALDAMIRETGDTAIATLQGLSHSPRPWRLEGAAGDARGAAALSPAPALHFQRMDVRLDLESLAAIGLRCGEQELDAMRGSSPDDAVTLARLHEAGLRAGEAFFLGAEGEAKRDWTAAILPRRFDPHGFSKRFLGPPASKLDALRRAWKS